MGRLFALSSCRFTGMFFVAFVLAVSLSTRARAELVRETLVPGDTNCDGQLDMSDAVFTLNYLFLGTTFPPCPFADRPELLAQVESLEMSRALLEHTIAGLQAELDEAQLEIRATGALLVETQTSLTETQTLLEACVQSLPKPAYTVRGLGFIADAPKHSIARAVNDVGQVVGYSGFGTKAYTWQAGTLTYIGHLAPSGGMQAMDINNSGFLVGLISGALGPLPFVLEGDSLSPLPVSPGSNSGMAIAVNDLGQIVGGNDGAVLWSEGQRIPLASGVMANDINTSGQVVGTASVNSNHHAAFWQNGVFTDLGTLPGGQSSQAHSINDAGEIVGTSALNHTGSGTTPSRAVFWSYGVARFAGAGRVHNLDVRAV